MTAGPEHPQRSADLTRHQPPAEDGTSARRPRLVMVVMNHITGDSRVQKAATSMAAAGWEVYLLGRSRTDRQETSRLGGPGADAATVIRVPTGSAVATRRKQSWRRGIAGRVGFRTPEDELADRYEVRFRRLEAAASGSTGPVATADLFVRRAVHALRRRATRRHARALAHPSPLAVRVRGLALRTFVRGGGWRRTMPYLIDWDLAFGPVIDELAPDLIHAHDITTIGLAVRAAERARAAGRACAVVYDAHEWSAGVRAYNAEQRAGVLGLEREYIRRADAVVTVSEPIAALLRDTYRLPVPPSVVANAPVVARIRHDAAAPNLRRTTAVADGVPLLVYSGWLAPARGVMTAVEALPLLPEVHLAVVAGSRNAHVTALEARAARLGVADRVHIAPYVAPDDVVAYLSSADVGLIPNLHEPNSELSLITKYAEYLHARLPIVVSDVRTMAETTRGLGNGEVFTAGDARALAGAVSRVLADPARYRAAYDDPALLAEHAWERQHAVLAAVYRRVCPLAPAAVPPAVPAPAADGGPRGAAGRGTGDAASADGAADTPSGRTPALLIGPSNMAGQAWEWTRAARRHLPELSTEVAALERPGNPLTFAADRRITAREWTSATWQAAEQVRITSAFTHVLFENGLALTGGRGGGTFLADARAFADAGLRVGVVLHGSEIRDPRRHRALQRDSPFADPNDPETARLQERHDALAAELAGFDGPVYVSTLDLLDFVPDAAWLPVTVDTAVWTPGPEPLGGGGRPVVLHAPSRGSIKGSTAVDTAAGRLAADGLIDYRRIEGVAPEEMPDLVRSADVVLDQFAVGGYGVLAAQAMAAGRCVVGNVSPRVRARLLHGLPIVQADGADLADVLLALVKDPARVTAAAAAGPPFVGRHHDGTAAALVLASFVAG